jgi:Peptidase_C39 like family
MLSLSKVLSGLLMIVVISGCRVESHDDGFVLDVYYSPAHKEHAEWAAATSMLFNYHNVYYTQDELIYYQYHYANYDTPSLADISWFLFDLAGLDSYITGSLTFSEIRYNIDHGKPILLQYGGYYSGHILVLHGYDQQGYVYIHEQGYGVRVLHYDDLYYRYFHNAGYFWESSLVLNN